MWKTIDNMAFTNSAKEYSEYSGATTYAVGDVVSYLQELYICILASIGNLPTNITYWDDYYTNSAKNSATFTNSAKS